MNWSLPPKGVAPKSREMERMILLYIACVIKNMLENDVCVYWVTDEGDEFHVHLYMFVAKMRNEEMLWNIFCKEENIQGNSRSERMNETPKEI